MSIKVIVINTKNNLELIRNYEESYFDKVNYECELYEMATMLLSSPVKSEWDGVEAKPERPSHLITNPDDELLKEEPDDIRLSDVPF